MLARQGFERESRDRLRQEANWMALFLSSQCGEVVTAAQLLGEPEPDPAEVASSRVAEAEKRLATMQAKRGRVDGR